VQNEEKVMRLLHIPTPRHHIIDALGMKGNTVDRIMKRLRKTGRIVQQGTTKSKNGRGAAPLWVVTPEVIT
jgi:threonine dehydrogenase-like Zn-dependent dehydrogenase